MNANASMIMRLVFKTIEEEPVASLISFLKEKTGEVFEVSKYEPSDEELDECMLASLERITDYSAVKIYKAFIEFMTTTEQGGWLLFEEASVHHHTYNENLFRNEIEIHMLKVQANRDTHRVVELSKELVKLKSEVSGLTMFLDSLGISSFPTMLYMMDQQIVGLGGAKSVALVYPTQNTKKQLH